METPIALSVGSLIALIGFIYTWHKDSKETARQMQKLETEVESLKAQRQDIRELKKEIDEVKTDVSLMTMTITRIDTNVTHLLQDRQHN